MQRVNFPKVFPNFSLNRVTQGKIESSQIVSKYAFCADFIHQKVPNNTLSYFHVQFESLTAYQTAPESADSGAVFAYLSSMIESVGAGSPPPVCALGCAEMSVPTAGRRNPAPTVQYPVPTKKRAGTWTARCPNFPQHQNHRVGAGFPRPFPH